MDEIDETHDVFIAFKNTYIHTGKAVILGCLTTVSAFFSLYFAESKALHQMGVIAALGLLITLAAVFICIPALMALRLKLGELKRKASAYAVLEALGFRVQKYASFIVLAMLILSATFAIKAQDAKLNDNIYNLLPTEIETYQLLEKVKDNFAYNPDYLVCMVKSESELTRCVDGFSSVDELLKVESVLDYLPSNQTKKLALIAQAIEIHPEFGGISWLNVTSMSWRDLPQNLHHQWVSDNQEFLVKLTPAGDLFEESYQTRLLSDLHETHPNVTAQAVIWTKMTNRITTDVIQVSLLAALMIFFIVYIGLRRLNPLYACLSLIPVTFGILGLLGTYQIFGADINFITIMMIPLIIGIGIDDGIHIIHRYLEEGKGCIPRVIQRTGKAIFLTTATTVLAFSSFLFSVHPTMQFLGRIPIIGLSMCLIGALLFLPALLRTFIDTHFFKKKDKSV
jgi:predicted RND superfamily exporter protein